MNRQVLGRCRQKIKFLIESCLLHPNADLYYFILPCFAIKRKLLKCLINHDFFEFIEVFLFSK